MSGGPYFIFRHGERPPRTAPARWGAKGDGVFRTIAQARPDLDTPAKAQAEFGAAASSLSMGLDSFALTKAFAAGGELELPSGVWTLDWPVLLPAGGGHLVGRGAAASALQGAPDCRGPLLCAIPAESRNMPVTGGRLALGGTSPDGRITLTEAGGNYDGAAAFTAQVRFTPRAVGQGVSYWVFGSRGTLNNDQSVIAQALAVTVVDFGAGASYAVGITVNGAYNAYTLPAGGYVAGVDTRLVVVFDGARLRVWSVTAGGTTPLLDTALAGTLTVRPWEDWQVGVPADRWPAGTATLAAAPVDLKTVAFSGFALYTASAPPSGVAVADDSLGAYVDFGSRQEGAFVAATRAGRPAVLWWQNVGYLGTCAANVEKVGIRGGSRGLLLVNSNAGALRDLAVSDCDWALFFASQCYPSAVEHVRLSSGRCAVALLNNSTLGNLRDVHATAFQFGPVLSDSEARLEAVTVDGVSVCPLLVKGDGVRLTGSYVTLGNEADPAGPTYGAYFAGLKSFDVQFLASVYLSSNNVPLTVYGCENGRLSSPLFGTHAAGGVSLTPHCIGFPGAGPRTKIIVDPDTRWGSPAGPDSSYLTPLTDRPGWVESRGVLV